MKSLKSLFKPNGAGSGGSVKPTSTWAVGGGGGGDGDGGWEDFSTFSNNTPTIAREEEPHPLTKEWGARINNRNVRAEFLKEPIEGYTASHDLRVWTGTWNTNGKSPPANLDISEWLEKTKTTGVGVGVGGGRGPHPDIVVMGFQEIVPLTPGKVLAVEDSAATAEWEAIIGKALNGGGGDGGGSGGGGGGANSVGGGSAAPSVPAPASSAAPATVGTDAAVADPFVVENLWSGKPVPKSTTESGGGGGGGGGEGWTNFDAPSSAGARVGVGVGVGGPTEAGGSSGEDWTSFDAPSPAAKKTPPGPSPGPGPGPGGGGPGGPGGGGSGGFNNDVVNVNVTGGERPPTHNYVRLACKQLVGVYITVWATVEVASHARDIRVNTVSTGINLGLGVLGNKGGAAVWMKVYATPVVFICSHLSAGTKEGDELKRSEDYGEIVSKLSFPPPPTTSSDGTSQSAATVSDAFAAVWIGDLNYRLNLPDDVVRAALNAGEHVRLITGDQLLAEQKAGRAFVDWTEAPVTFPPTYKYRPGTNIYSGGAGVGVGSSGAEGDEDDINGGGSGGGGGVGAGVPVNMKEEKKKRTPAWCDRILWRGRDIRQLSYARAELVQSDHKPVMAEFTLTARELQPERLQDVLQDLRRRLDAAEMASQPRCTIENPQADLGQLRYAEPKSTTFRFVNTGDVPATWRFVPAMPGESALCPAWLSLTPVEGRLLPGEEIEIRATACIRGGGAAGPAVITGAAANTAAADGAGAGASGGTAGATGLGGGRETGGGGGGGGQGFENSSAETQQGAAAAAAAAAAMATTTITEAGTMAEAARRAAVRAVGSGLVTPTGSGGVTPATQPSTPAPLSRRGSSTALASLAELPDHPLDAIIVLHLEEGRDFFLTVAGQYVPSVFGQPLASLPSAAFPPDVPEPVGTMVDYLFDKGLQHVPGLLQPPTHAGCTLRGLAAVRGALDLGWGGAADLASVPGVNCHEVAGALLSFFASLPRPLLASPPACCAAIDAAMAPWAAAAAAAARAAGPGGRWTLAIPDVARLLPPPSAADELLRKHLPPPERATCKHTTAFLHALLKAPAALPGTVPASAVAARILAQFAEIWFPTEVQVPGRGTAATRMGRLAFVGVLCGATTGFLDGFNPMERMYDPDAIVVGGGGGGSGCGGGEADILTTTAPTAPVAGSMTGAFAAGGNASGTNSSHNLIDI